MDVASKLQEPIMALRSTPRLSHIFKSAFRTGHADGVLFGLVRTCSLHAQHTRTPHAEGTLHMASAALPHGRSVALGVYPALLAILSHCLLSDDDATR